MNNADLRVKIRFDADKSEITVARKELESLSKSLSSGSDYADRMALALKRAGHWGIGLYTVNEALENIVINGIRYNAQLETMQIGIASLVSVNSEATKGVDKFSASMNTSAVVMDMLKRANLETSATLSQLVEGFQSTVGPALKAGMSLEQTVEYTKLMTQAAGAMGVPMNQLAQEMRSVVSGTIDMNSVVAKNIGITNEQIKRHKEQGDLFEFLTQKLGDFAMAGEAVSNSFDGAVSNMEDAWDNFTGVLTKSTFELVKPALSSLTEWINDITESIEKAKAAAGSVFETQTYTQIAGKYEELADELDDVNRMLEEGTSLWESFVGGNTKLELEERKKYLEQQIRLLGNHANATLAAADAAVSSLKKIADEEKKSTESLKKELERYRSYMKKITLEMMDPLERLGKAYEEDLKKYGVTMADKEIITRYYSRKINDILDSVKKEEERNDEERLKRHTEMLDEFLKMTLDKETLFYKQLGEEIAKLSPLGTEKQFEYYEAAVKKHNDELEKSAKKTEDSAKTVAEAIYDEFEGTARHMTREFGSFFDYASNKFMDFGALAENILHEIYMSITRILVIEPLVQSITGALGSGGFSLFADGGVIDGGNVTPFADGGVVMSPTFFPMTTGVGVMGEAGPEAIMPLARTSSGELGVRVQGSAMTVNNYVTVQATNGKISNESLNQLTTRLAQVMNRSMRRNG